ncbi:hypothetical protein R1sor_017803 [Riccia sorocarpa]|uniref:BHLH domain-containing protein n=1 Tax=Riccia sorocarpa TaxID=122646 RepID=A0ABD3I906_9MARC
MAELAWLTSSPAAKVTVNGSSTFNNSNDNLFDLLQSRLGSATGSTYGGGTSAATDPSPFFRTSDQMCSVAAAVTDHTESSLSILKAEDGNDHLQPSLWLAAAADGIYSSSSAAAAHGPSSIDCNTTQLSTYIKPHDPSPQLQALRDFMAYGTSSSHHHQHHHHGHHSMPPNVPLENVSLSSAAAAPGPMFLHLGEDSPVSQLQQLIGMPHQSTSLVVDSCQTKSPDLMTYRALCQAELFATERSPHRTQFQRENHILAERQRREEMNEKFSALRAMIPKATKKDKASIVGDTIAYVLELEKTLKHLKSCKDSRKGYTLKCLRKKSSNSLKVMDDCDRSVSDNPPDPPVTTTAVEETKPGPSCTIGFEDITEVAEKSEGSPSEPTTNSFSEKIGGESDSDSKNKEQNRIMDTTIEIQDLGDQQAVIKIVCARSRGLVLRVLQALDDCKTEVLQSNVTSNSQQTVHFITVQVTSGLSSTREQMIQALQKASDPNQATPT